VSEFEPAFRQLSAVEQQLEHVRLAREGLLKGPVELRCLGGFVVTQRYGIGRETSDIDFLAVIAQSPGENVETRRGRRGSPPMESRMGPAQLDLGRL